MLLVTNISSDPQQQQTVILPDGSNFTINLSYSPQQLGWFITDFVYSNQSNQSAEPFTLNGMRIVVIPNMLRQFRNVLPFGLGCVTNTGREPTQQQDFSSGNFQLYVLTQAEVNQYEALLQS